jgi:hypothetical protein
MEYQRLERIYKSMKEKKYKPTTDEQLLKAVNTNIIRHEDLWKYKNINQIIKNNACIIFYNNTAGQVGHWVCITKRGNLIEFFDSYGRNVDNPRYIHGRPPYLKNLLFNSPYRITYNPYDFQKGKTSTCGRHVVTRILFKDYPLQQYKNFMENINDDDLVSFITLPI